MVLQESWESQYKLKGAEKKYDCELVGLRDHTSGILGSSCYLLGDTLKI